LLKHVVADLCMAQHILKHCNRIALHDGIAR
jgi:hypothetical protein